MSTAPRANEQFEVIASDDGFVVHDAAGGTVHYLNETAAIVFSLCDGQREVGEIAALLAEAYGLDEPPVGDVEAAVEQLRGRLIVL